MGKMKKRFTSLKRRFVIYFPVCVMVAFLGAYVVGITTNYLQDWYKKHYSDVSAEENYKILRTEDGQLMYFYMPNDGADVYYFIISNAQIIIIPVWVFACVLVTGTVFYNRELKEPIMALLDASGKISENQLDFSIECSRENELGELCRAFEDMRTALYENNRQMWRSLEERKRLNSAFSHDLRTPLTVLKGYADYLEKYVSEDKVPKEKLLSVLAMMNGQITRLEHYTQKMNMTQKLEDIVPQKKGISAAVLEDSIRETGKMVCKEKQFEMKMSSDCDELFLDFDLVMQIYENLISNAFRYSSNCVDVRCTVSAERLKIVVEDDGGGFSKEALKSAAEPFYRDEKEPDKTHFGLGLYICRIICEKCDGGLVIENGGHGGRVTAEIHCGKNDSHVL